MLTGNIFDIKQYAIHDGPGIRTTVFFKGCPLSCRWCHNPESISSTTQRFYRRQRCIGCQECVHACPQNAVQFSADGLTHTPCDCIFCETCAGVCPAEAISFIGRRMTVDEVVGEITKDTIFYDESDGGITISGGEPLMQPTFLMELLDACGKLDLHRTVDTSGHADTRLLLQTATRTDLFLYDLKHMDPIKHADFTGVTNEKILINLKILNRQGADIAVRFPIVPGFNSEPENVDRTGAFVASLAGVSRLHILPYHCGAVAKYKNLGLKNDPLKVAEPSRDFLASIAARLEQFNLDVKIGG